MRIEQNSVRNLRRAEKPLSAEQAGALLDKEDARSDVISSLRAALAYGEWGEGRLDFAGRIYWTRYLAGIFVFVGLLGTVWGIASAVASLGTSVTNISSAASTTDTGSSALTIQRWSTLLGGIENLLGGMRSAFYCTIAGLVATLLVSFLNSCYLATAGNVEACTRALAEDWFLPLYHAKESDQKSELAQIKQTVDLLALRQSDAQPDWKQPFEILMTASSTLSTSAKKLASSVDPALIRLETLHTLTGKLVNNLENVAQNLQQESLKAVERLEEANRQAIARLQEESGKMQVSLLEHETRLSTQQNAVAKATQDIADKYNRIGEKHEQMSAHARQLAEAAQTFPGYNAHLAEAAQGVRDAAKRMETAVETLRADLLLAQQQQHASLDSVAVNLAASHKTLDALLRRFELTLTDISEVTESAGVAQQRELQQIRATLAAELQRAQQTLNEVAQEATRNKQAVSAAREPRFQANAMPDHAQVSTLLRQETTNSDAPALEAIPWYRSESTAVVTALPTLPASIPPTSIPDDQPTSFPGATPVTPGSAPLAASDRSADQDDRWQSVDAPPSPFGSVTAAESAAKRGLLARLKALFHRKG